MLFDRGQPARHFYIVVDGQVNLVLYSKAGEEKIVDILGPGQSFAEAVMFMAGPGLPGLGRRGRAVADRALLEHRNTSRCCAKAPKPACACSGT